MTDETRAVTDGVSGPEATEDLAAWVPTGDETREDLLAMVRSLQGELLRRRDDAVGARAELATLQSRWDEIAEGDFAQALTRIDELEDQKEAMRHEILSAAAMHERIVGAYREGSEQQLAHVRASATWRVGSLVLTPMRIVRRGAGR